MLSWLFNNNAKISVYRDFGGLYETDQDVKVTCLSAVTAPNNSFSSFQSLPQRNLVNLFCIFFLTLEIDCSVIFNTVKVSVSNMLLYRDKPE
jgi:hypothetical protein